MNKLNNTALFIISLLVSLILAEASFRIYINYKMIYGMEMHKYAKKLKRPSSITGLSHEHIPNTAANLMGVNIKINNFGLRDNFIPKPKESNESRILFAGSSITLGWGVEYDSIFTTKLEHKLNENSYGKKYEVINSGIGNYNTQMEVIYTKSILKEVDPDLVILHFFLNDIEILSNNNDNFILKHSYLAAQLYLKYRQSKYASEGEFKNLGEYYLSMYETDHIGKSNAQNAIIELNNLCKSNDINFLILIQPDLNDLSYNSGQFKCHMIIRKFLEQNNISYLDLFDDFSKAAINNVQDIWVSHNDSHPNSKGHEIIFKSLLTFMNNL